MMAQDPQELYLDLTNLLDDICMFLSDIKQISSESRAIADQLINRSKKQLQEISKVLIVPKESDEEYVDMDRKEHQHTKLEIEIKDKIYKKQTIYCSVDDEVIPKPQYPQAFDYVCPFNALPAREMRTDIKTGELLLKRKFLCFHEKKRIYAGIHDNWLLIYSNEKDSKPMDSIDLKYYEAKMLDENTDAPKHDFEVLATGLVDKKKYTFIAKTFKDKLQWTTKINRWHDMPLILNQIAQIPSTENINGSFTNEIMNNSIPEEHTYESEQEQIYEYIGERDPEPEMEVKKLKEPIKKIPPDLPKRREVPMIPKPKPVNINTISTISNDSFSDEDDEDQTYSFFVQADVKEQYMNSPKVPPPVGKKPRFFK